MSNPGESDPSIVTDNPEITGTGGDVTVVADKILSPKVRSYIYVAAFILVPILAIVGWITDDMATKIVWTIGLVLGFGTTGLAAANRPQPAIVNGTVTVKSDI